MASPADYLTQTRGKSMFTTLCYHSLQTFEVACGASNCIATLATICRLLIRVRKSQLWIDDVSSFTSIPLSVSLRSRPSGTGLLEHVRVDHSARCRLE